jgi:hypothetical protein
MVASCSIRHAGETRCDTHLEVLAFGRCSASCGCAIVQLPPETASLDTVRATFETNVVGTLAVAQVFLPLLMRSTLGGALPW